ncbi:nucleoside deaminase [Gardnerella vaginalis]|uniref:nucleoside deaminase n=1 Tax=Gardnerella vaginalis TaxID=2702 RepID=UPI00200C3178|nr:nucleoside deaminase [Gardnerella vaginalis]UQA80261.1 nucleoside deaminase [Gardnerella vaginalis]
MTLRAREYVSLMQEALRLAQVAADCGEVPVGAVVVDASGAIIGRGSNLREKDADPLSHAEILAIGQAAEVRKSWNLSDCTLVVTLEPCPMCAGAILQTHISSVVFGAWDSKLGACGSVWDILRDPHIGSHPQVFGSVCESQCVQLLRNFFENHR